MNKIIGTVCYSKQPQICNGTGQILVVAVCAGQLHVFTMSSSKIPQNKMSYVGFLVTASCTPSKACIYIGKQKKKDTRVSWFVPPHSRLIVSICLTSQNQVVLSILLRIESHTAGRGFTASKLWKTGVAKSGGLRTIYAPRLLCRSSEAYTRSRNKELTPYYYYHNMQRIQKKAELMSKSLTELATKSQEGIQYRRWTAKNYHLKLWVVWCTEESN